MSLYARIEHGMYQNPKIIGLSDKAFRAYVESILWSGQHLTDGFLDARIVFRMWGQDVAEELASNDPVNPSWVAVEGGWLIHGFTERQTTRADVEAMREQKSKAGSKGAAKRWQNDGTTDGRTMAQGMAEAWPDTYTDTYTDTDTGGKRGTRLTATNFEITDSMMEWAATHCPGLNVKATTERFIDYWVAQPGQKGVKLDWVATWRNWLRKDYESKPVSQKPTPTRTASDASQYCVHGWPLGECERGC